MSRGKSEDGSGEKSELSKLSSCRAERELNKRRKNKMKQDEAASEGTGSCWQELVILGFTSKNSQTEMKQ